MFKKVSEVNCFFISSKIASKFLFNVNYTNCIQVAGSNEQGWPLHLFEILLLTLRHTAGSPTCIISLEVLKKLIWI